MPEHSDSSRSKVPFLDWLLFVTNFIWAFGIFRLLFYPAPNPEGLNSQYAVVWFGLAATVFVFVIRYLRQMREKKRL